MSTRSIYLSGFLLAVALLLLGVYVQYVDGIAPCPLCVFQRITFALLGFIFLLGVFLVRIPVLRTITATLAFLSALMGIALAGRQIWLQHFPGATDECGVSLDYMMQTLPMNEVLKKTLLEGSAECSARGWVFLTLNMAEWSLLCFIVFLGLSIALFLKQRQMH